jgi:hypothetical protein
VRLSNSGISSFLTPLKLLLRSPSCTSSARELLHLVLIGSQVVAHRMKDGLVPLEEFVAL